MAHEHLHLKDDFTVEHTHGKQIRVSMALLGTLAGGVARCVQKGDRAVTEKYLVSADVLGNASCFAFNYVGISNGIKEGGFAVIHMAKNGDDRGTWLQIGRVFAGDESPV